MRHFKRHHYTEYKNLADKCINNWNPSNSAIAQVIQSDQGRVNMQIKSGIECKGSEKYAYKDWMVNGNSKCEEKNGNNIIGCDTSSGVDEGDDTESNIASERCDRSKNYKKNPNIRLNYKLKLFKKINALPPSQRRIFIKDLNEKEVKSLCEIFINISSRKIPCDKITISKLRNYKSDINNLTNKTAFNKKKILRSIRGGFLLNLLLPIAVSFLTKLVK